MVGSGRRRTRERLSIECSGVVVEAEGRGGGAVDLPAFQMAMCGGRDGGWYLQVQSAHTQKVRDSPGGDFVRVVFLILGWMAGELPSGGGLKLSHLSISCSARVGLGVCVYFWNRGFDG